MSAEVLRKAAALMRERAEAAALTAPSPWFVDGSDICTDDQEPIETLSVITSGLHWQEAHEQRAHVASWHPVVALAVADWLLDAADDFQDLGAFETCTSFGSGAIAVANAYLGSNS